MATSPPQSQKAEARPISFVLDDQSAPGAAPVGLTLVVRPEDLTRTDPSRMNVQQTLGGAWADNFGPGLSTISISGHTGWSRRIVGGNELDGGERFLQLREQVFTRWHEARRAAARDGTDPDLVRLIFADSLNQFAGIVAPISFTLRRSKSRPLLCQYQIALTVLSFDIDQNPLAHQSTGLVGPIDNRALEQSGLDSLIASIDKITAYARDISTYIDRTFAAPVRAFMDQTARLYRHVNAAIVAVDDIAGSLISVARLTAQAGVNIFRTIKAIGSFPEQARARLMQVASAYSNIFCVLNNAVNQQEYYPDYNPLFGSANCSSTSGGSPLSPLSGVNPWFLYTPDNRALPVTVDTSAQTSLRMLASSDVVLAPMTGPALGAAISTATAGISVL